MNRYIRASFAIFALIFLLMLALPTSLVAQEATGTLRGVVTDPSGALVVQATVTVTGNGQSFTATSNKQGAYEIRGLAPGKYALTAEAKGFSAYTLTDVNVPSGQVQQLDIAFDIAVKQEQVVVQDETNGVAVDPSSNASATVLTGKDLEALSDDPDELQSDLEALAGPSAGPNGGQIYIDGFTGGTLPPKNAIREIRINQNPFSAEYDRLGYGRIEIFTKPGMDKFHGQFMFMENDKALNALNPYTPTLPNSSTLVSVPDYSTQQYMGNIGGPLSKKASFNFNIERRNINDAAIINSLNPDPALSSGAVSTPRMRTNISPRIDYQLTPNNTLTARYQFVQNDQENLGVGQLSEASQAYNSHSQEQTFQIGDTQVISPTIVNETRFQYIRTHNEQDALNPTLPQISVPGAFTAGGNSIVRASALTNQFELQNYTSISKGKHLLKFGGRLRVSRESSLSESGTNGSYMFDSLDAYTAATPSQYTQTVILASPFTNLSFADVGLYAEDTWKLRPNLTLSAGLRFESQSSISDHADWAPRIGLSWGLGSSKSAPKTVLRAGWGMFYDRFDEAQVLQAERLNGLNQATYIITNPSFNASGAPSNFGDATTSQQTTYQIDPHLQAPYTMQAAVSLERQLGKIGTVSVTYLNSRGVHQLFTDNINAPNSGVRLFDSNANIYQYQSEGIFKQNQLIVGSNIQAGSRLSLHSFYMLNYANSNTSGVSSFPTDQFNIAADYGRAAYDVRQRFFLGGSWSLPWMMRISPFIMANSGQPYNLTTGTDLNGDSIFNDRPSLVSYNTGIVSPSSCGTGYLNPNPQAGEKIVPINCGVGPAQVTFNVRFSKTIGIGPKLERGQSADAGPQGGPGGPPPGRGGPSGMGMTRPPHGMGNTTSDRRFNLTLSASVRNLFNTVNPGTPIGVISSPLFGQSTGLAGGPFSSSASAANRRIELGLQLAF